MSSTPKANEQRYRTVIEALPRNRARVPVPFDPHAVWGPKPEHHISGTVGGRPVRGSVAADGGGWSFSLGPAWLRDCSVAPGDHVEVVIAPEGIQRADLVPDLAAALQASPEAGAFFDSLAQFYRTAYVRWIDGTKRRPDVRAERIAEVVRLLAAGHKERPKPT